MEGITGTEGDGIVGRAAQLADLRTFLDAAASGSARSLLISGDAGVGKTALVQQACRAAGSAPWIFSGIALPLASMSVPFLALRTAFRNAPHVDGVEYPTNIISGQAHPDIPVIIDAWLDQLCPLRPVVLVIDDLHWADLSTLDVLMYLIAGPAERRLALIATLRNGEPGAGNRLLRWLADIRRLPRVEWMALGPLDRLNTGLQLAGLMGGPPHQSLVQDVFNHTGGNAYLNRLVVAGVHTGSRHLPSELPADLKVAVLRSWVALSPGAQTLTQFMAVDGRPIGAHELETLMPAVDQAMDPTERRSGGALALLHESAAAGILDCGPDATLWWFHHPMIAEALLQELDGDQRRSWHAVIAQHYEDQLSGQNPPDFQALAALADHHYAAGHAAAAFHAALRASAAAGEVGGAAEMLRLIRRALTLRSSVPEAQESFAQLWALLRAAAEETGQLEEELVAVEALLDLPDGGAATLAKAELWVRRSLLRFSTGKAFLPVEDARKAVLLAAVEPGSWQHGLALAELAHAGLWHDDTEAAACAGRALAVAEAAGNQRALSYALTANAMAAVFADRATAAIGFATRGVHAAVAARDFWAFVHATMWRANATECWSSLAFAELMSTGRQQLLDLSAPHTYVAKLAANEAASYLAVGRWRDCAKALRLALGRDPGVMADVDTRLVAARLAAWQGRQDEAEAHLARAEELYATNVAFLNMSFDAVRAEVLLAAGKLEAAYDAAMYGACTAGAPPTMCEWLIPLAARALADRIRQAQDGAHPTAELLALLNDLEARFPQVVSDEGYNSALSRQQLAAFNHWYAAELGRARAGSENAAQWTAAADAFHDVQFLWEETYCCWQGAESMLLRGHTQRATATLWLRRGLDLAEELAASPLRGRLEELAVRARIDTRHPDVAVRSHYEVLPGLTPREREILDHVVAGRTYGEIARSLVVSEKTVSSHISNMLRKTGAANRLDLSRLATRPLEVTPRPSS